MADSLIETIDKNVVERDIIRLENRRIHIEETIKDFLRKNDLNKKTITKEEEETLRRIVKNVEEYNKLKTLRYPDKFPKPQESISYFTSNGAKVIIRDEQDIRENIKIIANTVEKIPTDHLLNFLDENVRNKIVISKPGSVKLQNPKLNNDFETEKNLNKIYKELYDRLGEKTINLLNDQFLLAVEDDKKLLELLNKKDTSREGIIELTEKIIELKKVIYEKETGEEYLKPEIKLEEGSSNHFGGTTGKVLTIHTTPNRTFEEYLETIIHESTHQDQKSILNSKKEKYSFLKKLYEINGNLYLNKTFASYVNQIVEKEAFDSKNRVVNKLLEKIQK